MVAFCIFSKMHFDRVPTSFFIVSCTSFDHPPNTLEITLSPVPLHICVLQLEVKNDLSPLLSSQASGQFSSSGLHSDRALQYL